MNVLSPGLFVLTVKQALLLEVAATDNMSSTGHSFLQKVLMPLKSHVPKKLWASCPGISPPHPTGQAF
jgi:hypothetical protein